MLEDRTKIRSVRAEDQGCRGWQGPSKGVSRCLFVFAYIDFHTSTVFP